jgi:hypothetical protein
MQPEPSSHLGICKVKRPGLNWAAFLMQKGL